MAEVTVDAARQTAERPPPEAGEAAGRVLVEEREGVRWLTLHRPAKKNAFDVALASALASALATAAADEAVRVVVLRGAGDGFSSGADLNVFLELARGEREAIRRITRLEDDVLAFPKPLVAQVHGAAVGLGVLLLPLVDLVYAADDATFTLPFTRLGLTPELGATYTLPRLIGRQRTNELIFAARPIDAATAERWGLVTRVFPRDRLAEEVFEIARAIARRPAGAVAESKRLIRAGEAGAFEQARRRESEALAERYGGPENVAAAQAVLASRRQRL